MGELPATRRIERAIREQVESGALAPGDRLPNRGELAQEHGVSEGTIATVIRRLREAGYVTSDTSGVYVAETGSTAIASGGDRATRAVQAGKIYPAGEFARIVSAELVTAPDDVAGILDIPTGGQAIRRERVTYRENGDEPTPITYSVSWLPAAFADTAPELLATDRIPGGTVGLIAERTGRTISQGADRVWARGATEAEAAALSIPAGLPVLVGRNCWSDDDGHTIELGQFVVPPGRELVYAYRTRD